MTTRICVLGNSHVAAFKFGWDQIQPDYPDLELIFFAEGKGNAGRFHVAEGALVPDNESIRKTFEFMSGGRDRVPGDMDAYIVVGMGFAFRLLVQLFREHSIARFREPNSKQQLVSDDFLAEAMKSIIRESAAVTALSKLREISNAPIVMVPNPYMAKEVLSDPEHKYWNNRELREWVFGIYRTEVEAVRAKCILVEQPPETIEDRMFTKPEFSRGSVNLFEEGIRPHGQRDYKHMNTQFGAVSLRDILDNHLGKLTGRRR